MSTNYLNEFEFFWLHEVKLQNGKIIEVYNYDTTDYELHQAEAIAKYEKYYYLEKDYFINEKINSKEHKELINIIENIEWNT